MAEGQEESEQEEKDSRKNSVSIDDYSRSLPIQALRPEPARYSTKGEDKTQSDFNGKDDDEDGDEDGDGDEDDNEEDRPHLKYLRVTARLNAIYRNADVTSSVAILGDKMIIGTHNGIVHAFSIPSFQSLRFYRAHSASVTSISVWPALSSFPVSKLDSVDRKPINPSTVSAKQSLNSTSGFGSPRANILGAAISSNPAPTYIATSSIDGHVCVSSLSDPKDVILRNFARPVQAVALSPEYRSDRNYLSGGLAGQLILTNGGRPGVSTNANTTGPSAAASNWFSSVGLTASNGKDSVLHSGEGAISTIKWSPSGKYVVWVNEQGIKIMRSNVRLTSYETDLAWKRIGHVAKPPRAVWEEMGGLWKARVAWIEDKYLQPDEDEDKGQLLGDGRYPSTRASTNSNSELSEKSKYLPEKRLKEKLIIGWGDTAWILQIQHSGKGTGKNVGEQLVGTADILHMLRFDDCIISGISQYSPTKLLVLAYGNHARTDDSDSDDYGGSKSNNAQRARGTKNRRKGVSPELRMIDIVTKDEVEVDALTVTKYESLSAADYHLSTVYVPEPEAITAIQRGPLDALSGGLRDASASAGRILSTGASVVSFPTSSENVKSTPSQTQASSANTGPVAVKDDNVMASLTTPGLKVFIHSPYDCILAVTRDLADRLEWYIELEKYRDAWELMNEHPEIVASTPAMKGGSSSPSASSKAQGSLADFFADDDYQMLSGKKSSNSAVEKEKRRVGDLWLRQLITASDWPTAGRVAGKVLGTPSGWEYWVWKFAHANKFDEIAPWIPASQLYPRLPSLIYEVVLGHYIHNDAIRLKELLDRWDAELFNISSVTAAIEDKLNSGDVKPDTIEDGEKGRDWAIFTELLAKLYVADHRPRQAVRCYIQLKYAQEALALIKDYHLLQAIADDIPGFLMLRVTMEQIQDRSLEELEEASTESVHILADEAYQGAVKPDIVVSQLQKAGPQFQPFLYFYLASLWRGESSKRLPPKRQQQQVAEGRALVDQFGDLAVNVFAEYDRSLLLELLRLSQSYSFEHASAICEKREYIPELVYLLSATGQTKRALFLIISSLGDVSYAISFAKEQSDDDLWSDLLDYSMDKPLFIRALLEEVGTSINPVTLVRRIPEGLEIEGLPEGIRRMMRDFEIQSSISEGAAKVLRSDVAAGMELLRAGQRKAVRFEVAPDNDRRRGTAIVSETSKEKASKPVPVDVRVDDGEDAKSGEDAGISTPAAAAQAIQPGYCMICGKRFTQDERDILVGFACGHVQHLECLINADSLRDDRDGDVNGNVRNRTPENAKRLYAQLKAGMTGAGGSSGPGSDGFYKNSISGNDGFSGVRSVGAKVAHAHVVGSLVKAGCWVCQNQGRVKEEE